MRLKHIAVYGLVLIAIASVTAGAYAFPARRYYISTVYSWWPTYSDMSLFDKFIEESKQKGMNSISIDVPWSIENDLGGFDFAATDQRVDFAVSRGLSVFLRLNCTTMGGRPKWLSDDMLQATPDGKVFKRDTDGAMIPSLSHPSVRAHIAGFARAASLHYGARYPWTVSGEYPVVAISPALDLYMESEYYPDADLDYSKAAEASFASWVKRQYKSLDALNARWGKNCKSWSQATLKDAHPTARYMFFESELSRACREFAGAVHTASAIRVGIHSGCAFDSPRRRTMNVSAMLSGVDWLFISDAPTVNHAFAVDYARTSAPMLKVASGIDSPSHAEGTNGRYFNQGVRAFEHGACAVVLANWDLSNMRDNARWPFLHFVGKLTRSYPTATRPESAMYVSTWDLITRPNAIDEYIPTYQALSGEGKHAVDVLSDAAIVSDPARLARYSEIHLPANRTIPPAVRQALVRVRDKLKISRPLVAGTMDEYGQLTDRFKP